MKPDYSNIKLHQGHVDEYDYYWSSQDLEGHWRQTFLTGPTKTFLCPFLEKQQETKKKAQYREDIFWH